MIVRKLRLKKGWSQDQLAQLSGLNIRTIQRIERGKNASLESLKSLAAVFEVEITELQPETAMHSDTQVTDEERHAFEQVREIRHFYKHLLTYVFTIILLFFINLITSPQYFWVMWPAMGWGIGIAIHAIDAFGLFDLFGPEWEKKEVEKRLGRKL